MLEVELDGALDFLVILVAVSNLKIDKQAKVIVKRKQFIFLRFVSLQLLFEYGRLAAHYEVLRAAVITGVVLGHELLNSDAVSFIDDIIFVVCARAVSALDFRFFYVN